MRAPLLALPLFAALLFAQDAPPNGPRKVDPGWHALVAKKIHIRPGETLEGGRIVIKDGRIVSVSPNPVPAGARVWEVDTVYAGFIDAHVAVDGDPHKGTHWNKKVTPGRTASSIDDDAAKELRSLGFTAAVAAPNSGIYRGRAALVSLAKKKQSVYLANVYQAMAFERFSDSKDGFPTAQMGAIAVMRQGLHDGLAKDERLAFVTADELEALRGAKVAAEFKRKAIIVGSGRELRRLGAIVGTGLPVILPLDFPDAPDVASVDAQQRADLRALLFWEHAPFNPKLLDDARVLVALTTHRLKERADFAKNLRKAIHHGLSKKTALAMLTTQPAELLGVSEEMGTVEAGRRANLVIADGDVFDEHTRIRSVWIDGKRTDTGAPRPLDLKGVWKIQTLPVLKTPLQLQVREKNRMRMRAGETKPKPVQEKRLRENRLDFTFRGMTFSGTVAANKKSIHGHGVDDGGRNFVWTATYAGPPKGKADDDEDEPEVAPAPAPPHLLLPYGPYGRDHLPRQPKRLLYRGATLWTSGPAGIIENGDLLIGGGKVLYAGPRKDHGDVETIDATGKHITPGIVDCHSHTGISKGVNDSGQACTAEVRIGDVTNPDHISWYRQLASGVTTVNSLHGSANPIGGQSQTNKVRWGAVHPDDMHFDSAKPGIKFALGENVKQSNWGDDYKTRYPQTRMGVEAIMRDRFLAAREYAKKHDRVDLELEALAEILAGERLIHCHSYRQDEILMLARLAKEFGFRIGTFQHILEGYKVTDAIKQHAIGASAFSDWWAYKVEVQDAIPYNGPIMHEAGIVVSYNSDSDELVRRLHLEAAKAVKYGGLKPAEALKFVTINPAIQLGIDKMVGSLESGKHADFAVWSGDPLSVYTRCTETWIDGRPYYSDKKDAQHRTWIASERKRLIARILSEPKPRERGSGRGPSREEPAYFLCGECGFRGER
jgi:imidazolonepropionase-like amidohydrolase